MILEFLKNIGLPPKHESGALVCVKHPMELVLIETVSLDALGYVYEVRSSKQGLYSVLHNNITKLPYITGEKIHDKGQLLRVDGYSVNKYDAILMHCTKLTKRGKPFKRNPSHLIILKN